MSQQTPAPDLPNDNGSESNEQSRSVGVSQQKLEANRANSRKSTGPKTIRGKNITRFNALRHGAYVNELFIAHGKHLKQHGKFNQLSEELQKQLASGAYLEDKVFIQTYVTAVWRLEQLTELELRVGEEGGAVALAEQYPNFARMLGQAIRNCERAYDRLKELRLVVEEMEAAELEVDAADALAACPES